MTVERKSDEYMETLERAEAVLEEALEVLDQEDALRLLHALAARHGFEATPSSGKLVEWRDQAESALTKAKGNKIDAIKYFRSAAGVDLLSAKKAIEAVLSSR